MQGYIGTHLLAKNFFHISVASWAAKLPYI